MRLTEKAIKLGLVSKERQEKFLEKKHKIIQGIELLKTLSISPSELVKYDISIKQDGVKRTAFELLSFPNISMNDLIKIWPEIENINKKIREQIEIDGMYRPYIDRSLKNIELFKKEENLRIPKDFDYNSIGSLSNEVKEKFNQYRPFTIGNAIKIPGITQASVMALLIAIKNKETE